MKILPQKNQIDRHCRTRASIPALLGVVAALLSAPLSSAEDPGTFNDPFLGKIIKQISDSSDTLTNFVEQTRLHHKPAYSQTWNEDLDALPTYKPEQNATGTIRVWGDDSLARDPMLTYWAGGFHRYQPEVKFTFHMKSSLVGFPALVMGVADFVFMSHQPKFDEAKSFTEAKGHPPCVITIATGSLDSHAYDPALGIFVNKDNPISALTIKQLDGILGGPREGGWVGTNWHPEYARTAKENIRTWGEAGLTGEWASKPIHVYGYNAKLGQRQIIEEGVLQGGTTWNENIKEFTPPLYMPQGSDPSLHSLEPTFESATKYVTNNEVAMMDALGKDPYGIAYCTTYNLTPQVKLLALAPREGGKPVEISLETVQNRSYPLFRSKYICIDREPGMPIDPKLKEFIRYILSKEGQQDVVRDAKYLPLTIETVNGELRKLQ